MDLQTSRIVPEMSEFELPASTSNPIHKPAQSYHHMWSNICGYDNFATTEIFQDGTTPLYITCQKGLIQVVKYLIAAKADINYQRKVYIRRSHALHLAMYSHV